MRRKVDSVFRDSIGVVLYLMERLDNLSELPTAHGFAAPSQPVDFLLEHANTVVQSDASGDAATWNTLPRAERACSVFCCPCFKIDSTPNGAPLADSGGNRIKNPSSAATECFDCSTFKASRPVWPTPWNASSVSAVLSCSFMASTARRTRSHGMPPLFENLWSASRPDGCHDADVPALWRPRSRAQILPVFNDTTENGHSESGGRRSYWRRSTAWAIACSG